MKTIDKNYCPNCEIDMVKVTRYKPNPNIKTLEGCPKCGFFTLEKAEDDYRWMQGKPGSLVFVN